MHRDACVALAALDAVVRVQRPPGERAIPFGDFRRLPGDTPNVDTNLQPNELIIAVDLPALPFAARSHRQHARRSDALRACSISTLGPTTTACSSEANSPWKAQKFEPP